MDRSKEEDSLARERRTATQTRTSRANQLQQKAAYYYTPYRSPQVDRASTYTGYEMDSSSENNYLYKSYLTDKKDTNITRYRRGTLPYKDLEHHDEEAHLLWDRHNQDLLLSYSFHQQGRHA